jgi:hypothetical protein
MTALLLGGAAVLLVLGLWLLREDARRGGSR